MASSVCKKSDTSKGENRRAEARRKSCLYTESECLPGNREARELQQPGSWQRRGVGVGGKSQEDNIISIYEEELKEAGGQHEL